MGRGDIIKNEELDRLMITKTIKLRITKFDTADWKTLRKSLYSVKKDLCKTANAIISRLFAMDCGALPKPKKDDQKNDMPLSTYCYRLITGKNGEKVYDPYLLEVGGGVKSALAQKIWQRYRTDKKKIHRGEQSLPNFKGNLPIPIRQQEIKIINKNTIQITIWAKKEKMPPIKISVKPNGNNYIVIWDNIVGGKYKYKSAELNVDKKHRWFIHLVYSFEPTTINNAKNTVLGIDIGMTDLACCALYDIDNKIFIQYKKFSSPVKFWKIFQMSLRQRKEVGESNNANYNIRSGKGMKRKIRPLSKLSDKYNRQKNDVIHNVVSAIISFCIDNKCNNIAIEDLGWSNNALIKDTEDKNTSTRKYLRKMFSKFNYGLFISILKQKCKEFSINITEVDAKDTSKDCSNCGKKGKRNSKRFECKCGTYRKKGVCDADLNAARNICIRATSAILAGASICSIRNADQEDSVMGVCPPGKGDRAMSARGDVKQKMALPLANSQRSLSPVLMNKDVSTSNLEKSPIKEALDQGDISVPE